MRSVGLPTTLSWSIGLVGGSVEFHRVAPRLRQHRAERAFDQRQLEKSFARRRGTVEQPCRDRLGAAWHSASAASTRHGLCATPPKATRPVPSGCTIAPTEISAKA